MNSSEGKTIEFFGVYFVELNLWSFVLYISVTTIGVFSNGFLIVAILKDPLKCFRNATSYFIFHLAFVDALCAMVFMEESLLWFTKFKSIDGLPKWFGIINTGVFEMILFINFSSVFSLSLERCLAIVSPLWHKVKLTSKACYSWLAMIWILGLFLLGIRYFALIYFNQKQAYSIMAKVVWGIALSALVCYVIAVISVRRQRLALEGRTTISETSRRSTEIRLRNENRFLRTMFIVISVLLLGLVPAMVLFIITNGAITMETSNNATGYIGIASDVMFLLNCAVNPFIYVWRLPKYRKTFEVVYCKRNV
ncbi:mas-related G-protein coupled receptor member A3-like [Dendronephthya gigantea]|uniref:mas-related G-protein coupled receptor member A3-like n=1 Tax=Dendronephthya gigantea TaxID=151771 RepID=UPI00106B22E7|nr:mas-related G-protein coupled receptor member A3-like [Dendronephthya gigantea]